MYMKKTFHLLLSLILFGGILFATPSAVSAQIVASGNLGPDGKEASVTYTLDDAGTLTISGNSDIKNYPLAAGLSPFYNNQGIKKVVIEEGVTSIGDYLFFSCQKITSVSLPDSLTRIGKYAFCNTSLSSVSLPGGLKDIGEGAFFDSNITDITIPASVTSMGRSILRNSTGTMTIEPGNTSYKLVDGVLFTYDGKTLLEFPASRSGSYTVPQGTQEIAKSAFLACQNLQAITFPEGLTEIGNFAFADCSSLSYLKIPGSITKIGNYVLDFSYSCKIEYNGCAACWNKVSIGNQDVDLNPDFLYSAWHGNNDATCLSDGTKTGKCSVCGSTSTVTDEGSRTGHSISFTADGNTITGTCRNSGCSFKETAVLSLKKKEYTYTGAAICPAEVNYSDNWTGEKNGVISYKNNLRSGTAYAALTIGGVSVKAPFTIKQSLKDLRTENTGALVASQKAKVTAAKLSVTWCRIEAADGYEIYVAKCDSQSFPKKPAKTIKKKNVTSYSFSKVGGKKLDGGEAYKIRVKAFCYRNGKKVYIGATQAMHVVSSQNDTYTNAKKITVAKKKLTLKTGKTATISAKLVKEDKNKKLLGHVAKFRYYSTDTSIATVSAKGKIRAVSSGNVKIYVIAENGVKTAVTVTVKK